MKRFFNILFIFSILQLAIIQTQGQDLPSVCAGTTERYWVKGFNGISDFSWAITDPDGNTLPASMYSLVGRGDTVEISWGDGLKGGIYTFSVVETTDYGCSGEPYTQNIVLNSHEIFIPFSSMPTNQAICFGDSAKLDSGTGYLDYLWQDGSTNQLFYTDTAGTFRVRLVDTEQNCSFDTTNVIVNPLPYIWLGNDTVLFGNQTLTLDAFNEEFDFYTWSTGAISSSIDVDGQSGNQTIWVVVTDYNGCDNSDTINISSDDYNNLKIPAAFTPNGDGHNDTWVFPQRSEDGLELWPYLTDVSVVVFNRYGSLVWESDGPFKAWDGRDRHGRELPMDSYHYIIRIKMNTKTYMYKGSITIVR